MLKFLRENWVWIVAPIVVVLVIIAVLALTNDDPVSPFQYQLF